MDIIVEFLFNFSIAFFSSTFYNIFVMFFHQNRSTERKEREQVKKGNSLPVKTVYYADENNDEFSVSNIKARKIDKNYVYINKSFLWRIGRFFAYRLVATPIAFLYSKLFLAQRVKNKKAVRSFRKKGYFLFVNHTQQIGDAFLPNVALFPKSVYMIVHPDNVSQKFFGKVTPYLGAIPTPTTISAMRNFRNAVEKRILEGNCITVYPEAHIWPYYTGIRNFSSTSFSFPVDFDEPSFVMTNTYKKRKLFKRPRIVSYIDGPFYPNPDVPKRDRAEDLRNRIYNKMKERSELSDCEYIRYLPREQANKEEKQ